MYMFVVKITCRDILVDFLDNYTCTCIVLARVGRPDCLAGKCVKRRMAYIIPVFF